MSDFEDFARAAAQPRVAASSPSAGLERVAVLGGGADARLIAAVSLSKSKQVTLFSAYGSELEEMRAASGITLRGAGPIGTYHVDREAGPSVRLTAELDRAVGQAQVIFLTGPIHKQRTYAMVLADHLIAGQILVLVQGRTFGALETRWLLAAGGCTAEVSIVEGHLPYWYRAEGAVLELSQIADIPAGMVPGGGAAQLDDGPGGVLSYLCLMRSSLESSFNDCSGLVDVPALVLGGRGLTPGGPHVPMGGQPLEGNVSFANLIGADHRAVIHDLVEERRRVAQVFGVRHIPDTDTVIGCFAGAARGAGARPVPDAAQAKVLLRDAVIGSLVPLISAAEVAGVATPATAAMVTLVSSVLGADLSTIGRKLPALGIDGGDVASARRALETATGSP